MVCFKTFMFLYGLLHFPHLIFILRFILREIALGILNSVFLSPVNSFMNAVASLILRHMMLSRLSGHLCLSYKTKIDMFPSRRKAFPFLDSFLIPLSFHIRNLNPAFPNLPLFSTHYFNIFTHVCCNSRSWTWRHLFHSIILPPCLITFALVWTIWNVIVMLFSCAIRGVWLNLIF
jgi:hypothetical protein